MKYLILTSAMALVLSGCATTDIARTANVIKKAKVASKVVGGAADMVKTNTPASVAAITPVTLTEAAPINTAPMSVTMKKLSGKTKILSMQPKIALVGYNVGGYTTATATGKASGDLLGYSQGSRTTITMNASGITPEILQRVADSAHDDLAAKLTKAGFQVVTAQQVKATPSSGNLKFGEPTYQTTLTTDLGKKTVIVAGPSGVGTQKHVAIGKGALSGNAIIKPSKELGAVMLMPNLVLDFAALKAKGGAMTTRSSASGNVRFAIDTASQMNFQASKGRFLDGWLNYGIKNPVISDANFAALSENKGKSKSNTFERGLGAALGMATGAKKTKAVDVAVDPVRYEALAMSAAAGWNDAFVTELVKAK